MFWFEGQAYEPSIPMSVVGTVTYLLCMTLGNGLHVSIMLFEKNGSDPQKRSVGNQMVSFICILALAHTCVSGTVVEFHFLFGPVGFYLAAIAHMTR